MYSLFFFYHIYRDVQPSPQSVLNIPSSWKESLDSLPVILYFTQTRKGHLTYSMKILIYWIFVAKISVFSNRVSQSPFCLWEMMLIAMCGMERNLNQRNQFLFSPSLYSLLTSNIYGNIFTLLYGLYSTEIPSFLTLQANQH